MPLSCFETLGGNRGFRLFRPSYVSSTASPVDQVVRAAGSSGPGHHARPTNPKGGFAEEVLLNGRSLPAETTRGLMRSISLCLATAFLLLLAGCAPKSTKQISLTPLTISMGKDCTAYVFTNDVLRYTFSAPGTQAVQQGTYTVNIMCPTGKQSFLGFKIDIVPVELAAGPGADVNALDTTVIHPSPQ